MTQKNNTETAALYIEQAITNLRDLDANETPANFWDWVYVAEQALEHAPQCMSSLIENCFQYLAKIEGSAPNPARHRFRTIYLNRLAALALAKQGQLEQAIKIGRDCCYYINIENEDDVAHDLTFIAHWISWLEQTQQFEELATFALACAFHCRPKALQTAYHLALSYVDLDTPQKERWALILAWAALSDEAQQYVDKPTQPAAYYLAMVASDSVYQPLIALMQGVCLTPEQQNETQILELLERGINHFPGFADNEVLLKLWGLRFQLYGDQALTLPYPPCSGGNWTYNLATVFNHIDRHSGNFSPYMTDLDQLPSQEQLNDLAKYYFESGLKCFENFWTTGKGNYPDGYVHSYSMLCNNYSGLLRDSYNNYDLAIEIHHKGFAASPFSEHLYGLLLCHIQRQDHAAIAHSAEKLWHYALEHGFSRHDPRYYLTEVSSALMELDRSSEIAIWLERLEQWWQTLIQNEDEDIDSTEQTLVQNGDTDPTDPAEIIDYYYSILPMLDKLAPAQPEAVLHRLREHSTGIRHTGDTGLLRCLGVIFLELQYYKEAMFYFEEAIAHIDDNTDPYDIEHAPQGLQACKEALNLIPTEEVSADNVATTTKKPWWKVW